MYKEILLPIDNSRYSDFGIDMGVALAKKFQSHLTGNHVYAARLHDNRFKQMESGLPEKYQGEKELQRQRDIHDGLITKGLEIISDSFLDAFEERCRIADIKCSKKTHEGKNYAKIVEDVQAAPYDLVIIGIQGLGAVNGSMIGSVCERVVRRIRTDTLITKNNRIFDRKIVVAVDGSPNSMAAVKAAVAIGKAFGTAVEAVSAFDPYFHYTAFNNIAGVLSEEAGKLFRFKEQEKLHEEIIDKGLAKIYQDHLNTAKRVAEADGLEITTTLLSGKPYEQILKYINDTSPSLLVIGRLGVHSANGLDIGSNTENLLRFAPCNILIVSRSFTPSEETKKTNEDSLPWTKDAEARLEVIPAFVRGMAMKAIESFAKDKGAKEITASIMEEAVEKLLPASAREKMMGIKKAENKGQGSGVKSQKSEESEGVAAGFSLREGTADEEVKWEEAALKRVENAPDFVRPGIYKLMAKKAKEKGYKVITSKFLSEIRDESMMMVTKRMKKLGFDDLNMMAFDKAKDKMKDSRKTEVIGIIKQFLAERTGKNEEIIKKFEKYFSGLADKNKPNE
ncbi:MAG: universal stress protein [Nitrospirota bacterium]